MNIRTVTRGDAALAAATLLLLISSFLPYYSGPCGIGGETCTANAWHSSFFPLLPAVFLLGIVAGVLVLLGHLMPRVPKPAGIGLTEWGVVLSVATLWSALWSLFGTPGPSHSIGAYLAFVFALILVIAAVATPLVPALAAPLLPPSTQAVGAGGYPVYGQPDQSGHAGYQQAPYQPSPGQQFEHGQPVQQAQPGRPFTGPQQGDAGYGYPQPGQAQAPAQAAQPQPSGYQQAEYQQPAPAQAQPAAAQAVTPQDTPPREREDSATALLTPVVKQSEAEQPRADVPTDSAEPQSLQKSRPEASSSVPSESASPSTSHPLSQSQSQSTAQAAQPAEAAPQPAAPVFAPFWFAVPAVRTLAPEQEGDSGPIGELVPGTWYLAIAQRGDALLTQTQEGKRGLLGDTSGIQRG